MAEDKIQQENLQEAAKIRDENVRSLVQYALKSAHRFAFPVFSPDGKTLVYTDYPERSTVTRALRLEGAQIQTVLERIPSSTATEQPYLTSKEATFSPDGSLLATMNYIDIGALPPGIKPNANLVWLWDTRTWKVTRVLSGHSNSISSLAFSNDGQRLLSGDRAGGVLIHDVSTGQVTTKWRYRDIFKRVFVSFRNRYGVEEALALTANNYYGTLDPREEAARAAKAELWEIKTGSLLNEFGAIKDARIAGFSPDPSHIAIAGYQDSITDRPNANLEVVNLDDPTEKPDPRPEFYFLTSVRYTPDGQNIIVSGLGSDGEILRVLGSPR